MENDEYYDIDSILAEYTKIPCIFQHYIDAETNLTGDMTDIPQGSRIELPFWLAKGLAQLTVERNQQLMQIELPKAFNVRVRNALEASPSAVDYRLLCPFFYVFGNKLLELVVIPDLSRVLERAFKTRLRDIMDYSQSGTNGMEVDFLQKLDETEKGIFKSGQESATLLRHWHNKKLFTLDYKPLK